MVLYLSLYIELTYKVAGVKAPLLWTDLIPKTCFTGRGNPGILHRHGENMKNPNPEPFLWGKSGNVNVQMMGGGHLFSPKMVYICVFTVCNVCGLLGLSRNISLKLIVECLRSEGGRRSGPRLTTSAVQELKLWDSVSLHALMGLALCCYDYLSWMDLISIWWGLGLRMGGGGRWLQSEMSPHGPGLKTGSF